MPARARLSESEVAEFLKGHRLWRLEEGELRRTYEFPSFQDSVRFVNEVAALAERESHHPDINLNYRRVTIALVTYDLDGVTRRDTEVAEKIDALKAGSTKPAR